ncbi:hypothetical protein Nepgr_029298 [Nepenthes gracilis]|uniref:Ninja-family protein n=1 Tax=Nepenthes gracilis TaxID=150966 RepID=A0AAD3TC76_NEPGR|nr:hypothetical protein Nepgr_029298 [Nepenthes gracilis]
MAEIEKGGDGLPTNSYPFPGHFLERFMPPLNQFARIKSEEEAGEEIELSLGLSLNGQFGVDPKRGKNLIRSSSIPDFLIPSIGSVETTRLASNSPAPLMRSCSLPADSDEEWRKRKELQTLRRVEAKRKRCEKRRNMRAAKCRENGEEANGIDEKKNNSVLSRQVGQPTWANGVRASFMGSGLEPNGRRGDEVLGGGGPEKVSRPPLSQVSAGSQGSGSSGIMALESPMTPEANKFEAKSPARAHSLPASGDQKPAVKGNVAEAIMTGKPVKRLGLPSNGTIEKTRNLLSDMPCVSAKGDGPKGKRIQGFLYRYKKGEDVSIVCVCHGSFLTPAEFVKHAGGGDVEHPLRHIVVIPPPL